MTNPVNAPSDFPAEFPSDDLTCVIDFLRGTGNLRQLAASLQALIGFTLGKILQRSVMEGMGDKSSQDNVAKLESLLAQVKGVAENTNEGLMMAFDWKSALSQFITIALPYLLKWLGTPA